jgi:hypothetical protein
VFLLEFRPLPLAAVEHLAEVFHCVPDILEADVERREAETQDVGMKATIAGPEIPNDVAGDQRLHDGIGTGATGQADL